MNTNYRFNINDKVSNVIANDYRLLQVMSRFGISLGFGEKDIAEVCKMCKVDAYTFISLINFVSSGFDYSIDVKRLNLRDLLKYLRNTHEYFLDFQFPNIRRHLLYSIDCSIKNELAFLVLKFFDEYVEEVRKHMKFEEKVTFKYVENIIDGTENIKLKKKNNLSILSLHHEDVEVKLMELKNLFIQYYPQTEINHALNAVLYELYNTQEDLLLHCKVEDSLFLPAVKNAEMISLKERQLNAGSNELDEQDAESTLSIREKDIVVCVAKGMANKEIADKLCLSINTVTTHRRNIAKKLSIHTPAGITIYAIVNKLVTLEEVNI